MHALRVGLLVGVAGVLLGAGTSRMAGADFEVANTLASGFGSLSQAILDANDNPGPDRIIFNIPGSGDGVPG